MDFTAMINPPQSTILAVRGALGVEFVGTFTAVIEKPVVVVM